MATDFDISVIVPVFNGADTLADCLASIRKSERVNIELIVIDDGSCDDSVSIAHQYADIVLEHGTNMGRHEGRCNGWHRATANTVVNIDQDVTIKPETLRVIANVLRDEPDVCAVTGRLASDHPREEFFSEYKNIYMNHMFDHLAGDVTFLYGSIFAIRKTAFEQFDLAGVDFAAHDTAWGIQISSRGGTIRFLKDLEVTHLKRYSFASLVANDFHIPFCWAEIYVAFGKWRELLPAIRSKAGFAHASIRQLGTLFISAVLMLALVAVLAFPGGISVAVLLALTVLWAWLSWPFFSFIRKRKGRRFAIGAVLFSIVDNLVMGMGALFGLVKFGITRTREPANQASA